MTRHGRALFVSAALLSAACSTTTYNADDLAAAERRVADEQQRDAPLTVAPAPDRVEIPLVVSRPPLEEVPGSLAISREELERRREAREIEAHLDELERRLARLGEERAGDEALAQLRDRTRRAEEMLLEAEETGADLQAELRAVVNDVEIELYRLLVRDDVESVEAAP